MAQPAADENKTEDPASTKYKIEDLYDIKKEKELLKLYVDTALAPEDKTWKKYKTKDSNLKVDYKYLGKGDNLCTVRGRTIVPNASVDTYYEFSEGGYHDSYNWEKGNDQMCTENSCVKCIDIDHEIVYGSYNSGFPKWIIWPRDFCYMKARYKLTDYKAADGKTYDISCTLCYSIDDKHPFYRKTQKDHVRALLKYSGYLFVKDKSDKTIKDSDCRACYVVYLDPCGWIPTWVVDKAAPDQGMVIKAMLDNWPKVQPLLDIRKKNGYKRDDEFMFDEPQPFDGLDGYDDVKGNDDEDVDDENKEEEEEVVEDDKKVVGGWKKAESQEMFDVANAVKEEVEEQAKKDGKDEFKIFEPVEGTKQVVAGTNFRVKIKVDDDKFVQVLVFRSLPPISYELKNVDYL